MFRFIICRRLFAACVALWLAAGALVVAEPPADAIAPSGDTNQTNEKVLVLTTGGTLRGQVSIEGERYLITRSNGQLEVPAAKVAFVCDSLDDAYEQQRNQLPRNTADAHLALADWCLRYDLLSQAERELSDARALEPHNGKVELLERRLAVVRQSKESLPGDAAETHNTKPMTDELRQLETKVAELPEGVVERFGRKVQPILVNNCTASGCHQPAGKQDYQLDRAVLHGLSNRRTTLRNLTATLALVDRESAQSSPLLTVPARPHGGMKQPILGARQSEQMRQLQEWVALATNTAVAVDEMTVAGEDPTPKPTTAEHRAPKRARPTVTHLPGHRAPIDGSRLPAASDSAADKSADDQTAGVAGNADVVPASDEQVESLFPKRPVRRGVERTAPKPEDPFDPEIFNRLSKSAASGVTTGAPSSSSR